MTNSIGFSHLQYSLVVVSTTLLGTKGWLGRPLGPKRAAEPPQTTIGDGFGHPLEPKGGLGVVSATPLGPRGQPSHPLVSKGVATGFYLILFL